MSDNGRTWIPQDILWEIGASFIDANVAMSSTVIEATIERVGRLLDSTAAGVWTIDPATMVGEKVYGWSLDEWSDIAKGVAVAPDPRVAEAVVAGGGIATVPLEMVVGHDTVEDRGWSGGVAVVAIIDQTAAEVVVLVLGSRRTDFDELDYELVRGTVLLLRQFYRRIHTEERLEQRQRLDGFTVTLAARLQTVGPDELDEVVDGALDDLRPLLDAESVVLVDVIDDHTVHVAVLASANDLPDEWRTVPVPDISAVPGAEGLSLREFVAEPRVVELAGLVDALMGPEMSDGFGLRNPPRQLALLPASIVDGDSLLAVVRHGETEWTAQEFDALSTLASVVAQARARVAAQQKSADMLVAQRLLHDAGKAFLEASPESAPAAMHQAISRIGEVLGADLGVIAAVESDHETVVITDSWSATGELDVEVGTTLNRNAFPLIDEMMTDATEVLVRDSSDDLADPLRDSDDGQWTTVVAPISGVGLAPGALTFIWASGDIGDREAARDLVNAAADLMAQLSVRIRAEADLRRRLDIDAVLSELADRFLRASLDTADEVTETAFERIGEFLDLRGLALRRIDPGEAVMEVVWAPKGRQRPQLGHVVGFDADTVLSAEQIEGYRRDPGEKLRRIMESQWGAGMSVHSMPVIVGGTVEATLNVAASCALVDRETEAIRSLALMLGQFRARLAEERTGRRRLASQHLLSATAATLAEATPDDYADVLDAVFAEVGAFTGLAGIVDWRVDNRHERYIRGHTWTAKTVPSRAFPDSTPWGDAPILDDARLEGRPSWRLLDIAEENAPSRVAIPRGAPDVDRILVAVRTETTGFNQETIDLLESVSQMVQEVDVRIAAQRYALAAFQGAPIGVVLRDELLNVITCNQAFVDFVGAESVGELIGTAPQYVYDDTYETVDWVEEANGQLTGEAAFRGPGGSRVWGQMRGSVIEGESGEYFWLIHIEDITERRRAEQLLRFQASHDELTGLANRRRLLEEIHRLEDGPESVAVLLLDLDRFKNINDSLGHDRGDELLVVIADRLRLAVRPGDLVARLGGDEFAIVLPGPVAVSEAEYVAERLMRLIGEPVVLGRQKIYPTASIGIAVADDQTAVDDLIRRADTAMYRAKSEGRARAESFDEELREAVHTRMATESGLRSALRSDELLVYYQPEVSLHDESVLGAEALVRWNHPEKGILPAAAFIEIAEETGLIVEIGELVLAEACAEAVTWGGDDGPIVRVNLAAAQLQREDTVTLVRSVLAETSLNPARLCLEITESAVMRDVNRSEEILHRLKNLGVHLAVDDFGTGFSSLAYLKRFPVDALKIDRTFVNDLAVDSEDVAFVRSIVSLAEALNLDVVAEGVETREQADLLIQLGCHRAQGFFFARPAPPEALRERLGLLT